MGSMIGMPKHAMAALGLACLPGGVMADTTKSDALGIAVIRVGDGPSARGAADNFTGIVHVEGRFQQELPARVGGATVTFDPGAHTGWHTHPLGQTLVVTRGHGFVQEWQQSVHAFGPGDVIWIPPGVKHWHGAAPEEAMTHVAISEMLYGTSVTWMEPVSDSQYAEAVDHQPR